MSERKKPWRLEVGDGGPGWLVPRTVPRAFHKRTTAIRYADKNYWPSCQCHRNARVYHEGTGESWERRRGPWFKTEDARERRSRHITEENCDGRQDDT